MQVEALDLEPWQAAIELPHSIKFCSTRKRSNESDSFGILKYYFQQSPRRKDFVIIASTALIVIGKEEPSLILYDTTEVVPTVPKLLMIT